MNHSIKIQIVFFQFFSYIYDRQGTSEFLVYAIHEGEYGFRKANTDSGGLTRIRDSQDRLSRANRELFVDFRKANSKPSVHFKRADTETY